MLAPTGARFFAAFSLCRIGWLGGTANAVEIAAIMETKASHHPRRHRHFPRMREKRLLFLIILLLCTAFLQTIPWLISNDYALKGLGDLSTHPAFRYRLGTERSQSDTSGDVSLAAQILGQATMIYNKAAPSGRSEGGWHDDVLIAYETSEDVTRGAAKTARDTGRIGSAGSGSRGGSAGGSGVSNGGSFFVPFSSLTSNGGGGLASGSIGSLGGGYTGSSVTPTSVGTTLTQLSVVSP
jgi:hypothetical protein